MVRMELILAALFATSVQALPAMRVESIDSQEHGTMFAGASVVVGALCAVMLLALCTSKKKQQQKVEILLTNRRMTQIQLDRDGVHYAGSAFEVPLRSARSNLARSSHYGGPCMNGADEIKLRSEDITVGAHASCRSGSTSHHSSTYQSTLERSASSYHRQQESRTGSSRCKGDSNYRRGYSRGSGSYGYQAENSHGDCSSTSELTRGDEETLEMWRLDENQVKTIQLLSRGAYGEVWYGEYRTTPVAVKKLLASRSTNEETKKFVAEIVLMTKLESKYIVKFIGVSWYRKAEMMLVLEFMDQGDLRSILEKTTQQTFPLEDKINCAWSVAEGLVYLHTLDIKIIHRDIKSRNILMDSKKGTKLTDFGVSRETTSDTMTIGIGTYRWMAPEILTDSHYSHATDIYSFGIILAELDTHLIPYSDQVNDKGNPLNDTAIMGRVMQGNIQPTFSSLYPSSLIGLAKQCLSYRPEDRPTSLKVSHQLYQLKKQFASSGIY